MAKIGAVLVIGIIIATMAAGMYTYTLYQTNYIESVAGEIVTVGPVEYVITFDGTHEGNKQVVPENTFVMIRITAKNISDEKTMLTGGQFYIVDEKEQKHEAVYGEFSSTRSFCFCCCCCFYCCVSLSSTCCFFSCCCSFSFGYSHTNFAKVMRVIWYKSHITTLSIEKFDNFFD